MSIKRRPKLAGRFRGGEEEGGDNGGPLHDEARPRLLCKKQPITNRSTRRSLLQAALFHVKHLYVSKRESRLE